MCVYRRIIEIGEFHQPAGMICVPMSHAIRELTDAMTDSTGNMPPLPGIFPDYLAPIVRNQTGGRELMMARWGMPTPMNVRLIALERHTPA